jgi:titin
MNFVLSSAKIFEFTSPLKDVTVKEDDTAVFECEVNDEEAEVIWTVNGKPVKPDGEKYEVIVDGLVRRLLVHDCKESDVGTVAATLPTASTDAKLNVEGKPTFCLFRVVVLPFED